MTDTKQVIESAGYLLQIPMPDQGVFAIALLAAISFLLATRSVIQVLSSMIIGISAYYITKVAFARLGVGSITDDLVYYVAAILIIVIISLFVSRGMQRV